MPIVRATVEDEWMAIPTSYSEKHDSDGDGYIDSHEVGIDADTGHDTGAVLGDEDLNQLSFPCILKNNLCAQRVRLYL